MAKTKAVYVCESCGGHTLKWQGQCPDCREWNTLSETVVSVSGPHRAQMGGLSSGYTGEPQSRALSDVSEEVEPRLPSGIGELDRVLGGGLVSGAVILIGGDPGIGKSTLLLQASAAMSDRLTTLYISGEESLRQVALRARRLGVGDASVDLLAETRVEAVLAEAEGRKPQVIVIDSVQTLYTETLQSAPGSVAQLRESASQLVRYAKRTGCTVFLVGHVTKDGTIAGPRVLEHMVDTVLYFENDAGSRYRIIRAVKNRFGAANELGVFAMTGNGLKEVRNPSAIFLSRHEEPVAGSVITVAREGSRPMLLELQALVDENHGNYPKRISVGLEHNRLALLLAVLHRHGGIAMVDQDVFINVVGGVRINETSADLAAVIAALSSFRNRPVASDTVFFGEVGLAGEIRPVPFGEERIMEAAKHGFRRAVVPAKNMPRQKVPEVEVIPVTRLAQAIDIAQGN